LLCFLLGLFDFIFVVVLFSLRAMFVVRLAVDWCVEGRSRGILETTPRRQEERKIVLSFDDDAHDGQARLQQRGKKGIGV
jgi:hypothetical protein